ncbi:Protein takeout [Gryllus bimaculatus]|nr:Protein takeout [Gryllus bimaculatus]
MGSRRAVALPLLLPLLLACTAVHAAQLPPYLSKCPTRERVQFNECVLRQAQKAIDHLGSQGDRKFGFSPTDPIHFPLIETDSNGFNLKFINLKIATDPPQAYKVDSVDMDLDRKHLDFAYSAPVLNMISKYETDGRILILPVKGDGEALLRIDGYKAKFSADFDVVKNKQDGLDYVKLKNTKYSSDVSKVSYNFTNLFNGDQTLGKATNDFLNSNWKDVFEETKWSTFEAIRQFMTSQIQNFFDRVSYNEAFPQ